MSFTTITDEELVGKGVTGLPDIPQLSTEDMQTRFDNYSWLLKDKFKNLITELEAASAAASLGVSVPPALGNIQANLQAVIEGLIAYTDAVVVRIGAGDMAKAVYDTNGDGVVDYATVAIVARALTHVLAVEEGGTGSNTHPAGRVLVGNGQDPLQYRDISDVPGGVENSSALVTADALFQTFSAVAGYLTALDGTAITTIDDNKITIIDQYIRGSDLNAIIASLLTYIANTYKRRTDI